MIHYDKKKNGIVYASVVKKVRKGAKIVNQPVRNLGRVLDKEKLIFKNRQDGVFVYDEISDTLSRPPQEYIPPDTRSRKEKLIVDFGDSFALHEFLENLPIIQAVQHLKYGNTDTLWAMIFFYVLTDYANCHARQWYEGNYVKILYPKANLSSQRISDFLEAIGDENVKRSFFHYYLDDLKTLSSSDENHDGTDSRMNILIDSSGMPNDNHLPMTAVSNHNGIISNEIRLIYVVQKGTGLPVFFRYVPGNVIDVITLKRTIAELRAYHVDIGSAVLDAGYPSEDNYAALYELDIDFIIRIGMKYKIYKNLLEMYGNQIEREENAIFHNGRLLYVKKVECTLVEGHTAYAYIGLDTSMRNTKSQSVMRKAARNNAEVLSAMEKTGRRGRKPVKPRELVTGSEIHSSIEKLGYFIIVSSIDMEPEELIKTYYMRDQIEKVFHIGKDYANLLPLRVQTEETLRGHLMITFIAAVIIRQWQMELNRRDYSLDDALIELRNHKCDIFEDVILPDEGFKKVNLIYECLGVKCPCSILR